tara:strand:- start:1870 stop:2568 length:699 start_codon:yes stop_codon:yes gene_type:complete
MEGGNDISKNKGTTCTVKYTEAFINSIENYPFDDFLEVVREAHPEGRIWVIGSLVYGGIIRQLSELDGLGDFYRASPEKSPVDVDFLLEKHVPHVEWIRGWEPKRTTSKDLFYLRWDEKYRIDLNELHDFNSITVRNTLRKNKGERALPYNFESFLTGTPLNIQSIAFDPEERIVKGWRGIEAIEKRLIRGNEEYPEVTEYEARRRGISVETLIKNKAEELGFDFELPVDAN